MIPAPTAKKRSMWCGPYALAVVLGLSYDEAYELARQATRQERVKGMWNSEMEKVLRRQRIKAEFESLLAHAKIQNWWKDAAIVRKFTLRSCFDYLKPNRLYIVNVTRHYVVLDTSDRTVIDNRTEGWFPVEYHGSAGARVKRVAEVRKV